jgi:putative restriction endonuclease
VTKTDALLRRFRELNVWHRGEQRAPHKPLLVLYALGRLQAGAERLIPFDQLEEPLTRLLEEFGPPRKSQHPELPFYHLQHDGVWEIEEEAPLMRRQGSRNPLRSELRRFRTGGGFTQEIFDELRRKPEAVRELARMILGGHFPESLHRGISDAVGLELEATTRDRRRDSEFRSAVVSAWGHECAFCGYAVRLDNADLGLEAAHIRWCQFGGPDTIDNGLACCAIHHQALDRGAITLSDGLEIQVSSRLHGAGGLERLFVALHGGRLRKPNRREAVPRADFLAWHRTEVFRGEARG